jgi:hypothetical protein
MQKDALCHQLAMPSFNQSHLLRLLLMLLTWGLPHVTLAQGRPALPDSRWQPGFGVPEGTNGAVLAMVWARGNLYIGGSFTAVGGVAARNVARWDGRSWHAVGSGLNGPVLALACASSNRLLVGGSFTAFGNNSAAASHFAVLDPAACQPMGRSTVRGSRAGAKRVLARRPRPAHK